ncbi:type I 3-dehydroquinate dehydratase [Planctopirus hydrillae]|uniref:3-dehydroquinate dehydratase n=1 Tax=Planctopirus hydrillae TaxID=1841610 RepID=A0A1C3E847_9PLAN|nr:type I 3-dehydroquinate dehydratase [Planctopirus hydrillae]ODA29425.1 3-dehydroquinate dehydratase [Planctopirus hydrillae]
MICISVTPESRQLAKVDILNAARQSDLVELCLDRLLKEPDVKDLIESSKKPILVSCRSAENGGSWKGTEDERIQLLRQAILAGPAYVELDEAAAKKIPRFGKVQRVISYTSMNRPLHDLEEAFENAGILQADVIKFTWPTDLLEAAWPLLSVVSQKRAIPVVGLGLGKSGLTFSLLGRKYGSPWIYAALEKGMEAFVGQPTVSELDDVYRWRQIGPKTRFIAVVGFGLGETMLCKILNAGFDTLDLNTRCLPIEFRSVDSIPKMLDILKIPGVIATNYASRRVFPIASAQDEVSAISKAGDLYIKRPDGWASHNLIWKTALRLLEETLGRSGPEDRPLDRKNVMVVGKGGLAASLAVGIKKRNGLVSICSADDDEGQQIATMADARFVPLGKLYDTLVDVLVVASENLDHGSRKTSISPTIIRPGMTILDLSSMPADSPLIDEARVRGAKIVEPAEVFADYATNLFRSITGQELPPEAFAQGLAE